MGYTHAMMTGVSILSPMECKQIVGKFGHSFKEGGIQGNKVDTQVRNAQAIAIGIDNGKELYENLLPIVLKINQEMWKYKLDNHDHIQLLKYTPGGHYEWHMDMGPGNHATRKLSFIVGLSPTNKYEGGEIVLKAGPEEVSHKIEQGKMLIFPSFILHKVTPVTKGERYVLVGWLRGEAPFR